MSTVVPAEVIPGIYRHYKGGMYLVRGVARHANTEERGVLYLPLSPHEGKLPMLTYRPVDGKDGFFTPVLIDEVPQPRFLLIYATNETALEQQDFGVE